MTAEPRLLSDGSPCCAIGAPLCAECVDHFATIHAAEMVAAELPTEYDRITVPDPYRRDLATLRAASTPDSSFEANYKAGRLRAMQATRATLDADTYHFHLATAEELKPFAPPDPYAAGIRALKEKK